MSKPVITAFSILRKTPISLFLLALSGCLMLLAMDWQASLYFDRTAVESGNALSLLSAHFIHSDINHWFWNAIALFVLSVIIELKSRGLLLGALCMGIAAVDLLLLSNFSTLQYYCGLSGVLNTLLVASLWLVWEEYRSKWILLTGILCAGKIALEVSVNDSLLTQIQWPPYPAAHLAGALGGLVLIFIILIRREKQMLGTQAS